MPRFYLGRSTVQFKFPLQDSIFPSGQKGYTSNGTKLSHSSVKSQ